MMPSIVSLIEIIKSKYCKVWGQKMRRIMQYTVKQCLGEHVSQVETRGGEARAWGRPEGLSAVPRVNKAGGAEPRLGAGLRASAIGCSKGRSQGWGRA